MPEDPGFVRLLVGFARDIDLLLSGHDLRSLEKFAALLPELN